MKTLYITDLDGTLLNSSAEVSEYTVNTLNRLMSEGMNFTFATARTIYSAKVKTSGIRINVPCILSNGASVYDMTAGEYVRNAYIPSEVSKKIVSAYRENDSGCFVFRFLNGKLVTFYDTVNESMAVYLDERKGKFAQPYIKCEDVLEKIDDTAIYITSTGEYEKMLPIRDAVKAADGADCAFYEDTYTKLWYLESFSSAASKANGIKFLREKYGFERVVCFGDNLNDLSMFSQSDIKIAVGNAAPEVIEAADFVIGTNDKDGVARFLELIDEPINF